MVEYSDMDDESKEAIGEDGKLKFSAGNICIHAYSLRFLERDVSMDSLPKEYHLAKKKIAYVDPESGTSHLVSELKEPSGIKLETFIFDVFDRSSTMTALEVSRAEEFAPVKNAPGTSRDSPDTARALSSRLHRRWLVEAGARIVRPDSGVWEASRAAGDAAEGGGSSGVGGVEAAGKSPGASHGGAAKVSDDDEDDDGSPLVEVSPWVSYGGEGLDALKGAELRAPLLLALRTEEMGAGDARAEVVDLPSGGRLRHSITEAGVHVYEVLG